MGKVFGIVLLVLGIWMAAQFATGTSPFAKPDSDGHPASIAARSGAKVQAAFDEGSKRLDNMLEE